jgi:hypothetical protein
MWGRLVPRVSFSSDALGMPWEIMGVYIFLRKNANYMTKSPPKLTHHKREHSKMQAYVLTQNSKCTRY